MSTRFQTLEFHGGALKFASGHFTIFSATEREPLHGHTYQVQASLTSALDEPGITFDYRIFREKLAKLCGQLTYKFLLPTQSPYLTIEIKDDNYELMFNGKKLFFPVDDVVLLPISNVTLEELSQWFVAQITQSQEFFERHNVQSLQIKVFNGPEHCASADWVRTVGSYAYNCLSETEV